MSTPHYEKLEVRRFADRDAMGRAAADHVRGVIAAARAARGVARVLFACEPSQNEFLRALVAPPPAVPWSDVIVYHVAEFIGLSDSHPQSLRHYLRGHLLDAIPAPRAVHRLRGEATSLPEECARYEGILRERPLDLVCLGIGENGSLGFNDPVNASFDERALVKAVALDEKTRQQQVNDGCFARLKEVPTHALTVTVPALFGARAICGIVAGHRRAGAVCAALTEPVEESCPASILRAHPAAVLHLDEPAASLLP